MNKERDPTTLSIHIQDENLLAAAYMPFIDNGGLFVSTQRVLSMGEKVRLQLRLLDNHQARVCEAVVIWITPDSVEDVSRSGVGLQFTHQAVRIKTHIEDLLAANGGSATETFTL